MYILLCVCHFPMWCPGLCVTLDCIDSGSLPIFLTLPFGFLVCCVFLCFCQFLLCALGQVWYLIVSIPDLCLLYFFTVLSVSCSPVITCCLHFSILRPGSRVVLDCIISWSLPFSLRTIDTCYG